MARSDLLKQYESRLARLGEEAEEVGRQQAVLQKRASEIGQERADLRAKIAALTTNGTPVVTEHAMLRYLERVRGVDLEEVRRSVMPKDDERLMDAIRTLGGGVFPVGTSHSIRIQSGKVVTVLD